MVTTDARAHFKYIQSYDFRRYLYVMAPKSWIPSTQV